uniref:Uncharacterized protein n=1 Tax=Anguilla anguilla TaxID=7936 RepID=A0A0E9T237_ANGAN
MSRQEQYFLGSKVRAVACLWDHH